MDVKNLLIPAGLLYYSYSSNKELKDLIKEQQNTIMSNAAIIRELGKTVDDLTKDNEDLKGKLTPDEEKIKEHIKCTRFVLNLSGFGANSKWEYAIDAKFYNSFPAEDKDSLYHNYVIKSFVIVDSAVVTIPGGSSYTLNIQGSRLEDNGNGLNEYIYPENSVRINPLVSNKAVLMIDDKDRRKQFIKDLINYCNNKNSYKTKIATYADSRFNAILIEDAVKISFKILIKKKETNYTIWVPYDIKTDFYYIKCLDPRNVGTEIDIAEAKSLSENNEEV